MRSLAVVVVDVFTENPAEMLLVEDDQPVERFVADGLDYSLAVSVGARPSVGSERDSSAFASENRVKLVGELGVAVVDEELSRLLEVAQLPAQVSGLLGDPGRVGVGGAVDVEDAPTLDLQEDEHVERLQEQGVDGEEVAGQDGARMGAKELSPSRSVTAWRRRYAIATQDTANRGRRGPIAEPQQLN